MQKEQNILKRYFLSVATRLPFLEGVVVGGVVWICSIVLLMLAGGSPVLVVDLTLILFGGLGVTLGVINHTVCRRFVSYRSGLGAFFAYKGYRFTGHANLLAAAFGRLWFRKGQEGVAICWFGLPPIGVQREVTVVLSPFSVLLEVTFEGDFNLEEVFRRAVQRGKHEDFDGWLRSRVIKAAKASDAVQQILRQVSQRHPETLLPEMKTSLMVALKGAGFPKVLGNIEGIRWTLSYARTSMVTFEM